jgi:hypothetical protein
LNELQDAHEKAVSEASDALKTRVVKPNDARKLLNEEDCRFRQSKATTQLSRRIKRSVKGLRPESTEGAGGPTVETIINAAKFNRRVNALCDTTGNSVIMSRPEEAIWPERTARLLRIASDAAEIEKTKGVWKRLSRLGLRCGGILLPTLGGSGYKVAKHIAARAGRAEN